ncbi:hypothetical protein [Burkholderia vietnamiensis]|uniref:hypothetical protein n=1 Tax=Burkholderia vietnamiensis TaxID=60552 RepID=UPI001BA0E384|nr:hypothetical protein [Burkholderia vietnamiensis]MBR8151663.1 hypothetical protein [Burkholderia vietnamiensis]
MVTRANAARKRDVACVRIGFESYLMDADKAMQAIKVFRDAIRCERDYAGHRVRYIAGERPEVEMAIVSADDVVMPTGMPALEDRRR